MKLSQNQIAELLEVMYKNEYETGSKLWVPGDPELFDLIFKSVFETSRKNDEQRKGNK